MRTIALAGPVLVGMALTGAAQAAEVTSTTRITLDNGITISTTAKRFDVATGGFSRSGKVSLANGRSLTFSVSGTCSGDQAGADAGSAATCAFTGTANGPMGGGWTFSGDLKRSRDAAELSADITAPNGRTIQLHRTVSGHSPLMQSLMQF